MTSEPRSEISPGQKYPIPKMWAAESPLPHGNHAVNMLDHVSIMHRNACNRQRNTLCSSPSGARAAPYATSGGQLATLPFTAKAGVLIIAAMQDVLPGHCVLPGRQKLPALLSHGSSKIIKTRPAPCTMAAASVPMHINDCAGVQRSALGAWGAQAHRIRPLSHKSAKLRCCL